jgi:predicted PurR-regulated permease PerM
VFGLAIYLIIPPLVTQISDIANNAPQYIDRFTNYAATYNTETTQQILGSVSSYLGKMTEGFVGAVIALFGSIVSVLIVFALTFYLLLEEKGIRKTLTNLFPIKNRVRVGEMVQDISLKIGQWLKGQLILMATIALIISVALQVLGVPYALALGMMAGILELVPIIGPIISGLLAVIIAFGAGASLWQLVAIVIVYIVVQQLENNILVPKIMQKAIGVPPVVVIIAILVGSKLLGVGGAILAIPVVGIISVLSQEYLSARKIN